MRSGAIAVVDVVDAMLGLEWVGCEQRQALGDYLDGGMLDCPSGEDDGGGDLD